MESGAPECCAARSDERALRYVWVGSVWEAVRGTELVRWRLPLTLRLSQQSGAMADGQRQPRLQWRTADGTHSANRFEIMDAVSPSSFNHSSASTSS